MDVDAMAVEWITVWRSGERRELERLESSMGGNLLRMCFKKEQESCESEGQLGGLERRKRREACGLG